MPRKPRIEFPGSYYHVYNRGNYRRDLFNLPGAAAAFERTLFEACEAYAWLLHAFTIMQNHFHLALELQAPTLSVGMKWLQGTWSMRFNRFHHQVGRPFQGRFKAKIVQPGLNFARVVDYIHLNPVRAGIVAPEFVATAPFTSLRHFQNPERPPFLRTSTALSASGGLADNASGWNLYGEHLRTLALSGREAFKDINQQLRRGWYIGSEDYKAEVIKRTTQDGEGPPSGISAPEWNANIEDHWEGSLQLAASTAGIDLSSLPRKRSAKSKLLLADHMRAKTSASNVWLAKRLQMGTPNSFSQLLGRYRRRNRASPEKCHMSARDPFDLS